MLINETCVNDAFVISEHKRLCSIGILTLKLLNSQKRRTLSIIDRYFNGVIELKTSVNNQSSLLSQFSCEEHYKHFPNGFKSQKH
jgi:hypothetical protein